ncbi:hypothetical protein BCR42DRAFT_412682 [Absidia repens]|uniref:Uncharacterized protein n=1 Tax=Absidia repens TaxID=90262 RepID=A0A1X2IJZ1_9FUNG|nr:hypothetical protein BCR42DRAFT_412682 [Absidia repens]
MVHYYPKNSWDRVDFDTRYQRRQHAKLQQHYETPRRRSISKSHSRQPPSPILPPESQYAWPYYFEDEQDIYEPPLSYWESHETMPDDLMLDDYYMDAAPGPHWSFSTRLPQRRRSLASTKIQQQPDYYYDWIDDDGDNGNEDDDMYLFNEDEQILARQSNEYHQNRNGSGRYADFMTPSLSRSVTSRRRSLGSSHQRHQPTWDSDYGDYSDEEDFQHHQHHHPQDNKNHSPPWINSPVMGSSSPESSSPHPSSVLHQPSRHSRMEQGPLLSIDTQQQLGPPLLPTSFYGQAPTSILPMPQPMMPPPPAPPSFLPHHQHQHALNYGFPTMPSVMPGPPPFNPMMMPQPHYLPPLSDSTLPSSEKATAITSPTVAPSSDDAKSPQSAPDLTTTNSNTASPVNASSSSSATAASGENGLMPLARSLSLGTSQPLRAKPRRRSLFGSLFGHAGSEHQQQQALPSSSPSLIPVHELTKDSLTRKQSISLEKKAKALSQRSYIWCYRIKPSLVHQQKNYGDVDATSCWIAMVPRNQTKLDPYLCFYQPSAVVKGLIRTENLPTLLTLDKEPKLTGSITAMPQAKVARVYPSMFSSSNYIELVIDCLPADSQFVVRSD